MPTPPKRSPSGGRPPPPGAGARRAARPGEASYRRSAPKADDVPTWILVADARRARVFEADGLWRPWSLALDVRHVESRMKGDALLTDRPGRMAERGEAPKDQEARTFARHLAHTLDTGFARSAYAQLVLVSPARFLGEVLGSLKKQARRLVRTVERDFAQLPDRDLPSRVLERI